MWNSKVLIPVLLLCATLPLRADSHRISIRVTPAVSFAPANLVIRATVERDDANRSIVVVAESPTFYRSSEVTLDGARAPRITLLQFRNMPGGDYDVRAVVRGSSGQDLGFTETHVSIVSELGGR